MRLFVACELPRDVRQAIGEWQERQLAERRDVRANHALHLTLCFLGDTDASITPALVETLAALDWSPCEASFAGEALFLPGRGARRVVALALEDPGGGLHRLRSAVCAGLAAMGAFKPESRPWTPHVTVARFRRAGEPFLLQNVNIPGFCVVRMGLYSSSLERTGAVHTPIAVFPAS